MPCPVGIVATISLPARLVLVRIDPASVRLALDVAVRDAGLRGAWSVDAAARDALFAVLHRDGHVIVALTRFDGFGGAGGALPFGPTTPEMAALMGALGCRTAMLLDGGLSAQMLVRDHAGVERRWKGMRRVPLGLVAF